MVKLCVFDMDGLLLDTERLLYLQSALIVSREMNYPMDEEFLCSQMGANWPLYKSNIIKKMGKDFPIEEYLDRLWERIDHIIENEKIPFRPGAKEILDYCKQNNIKMVIATSTPAEKSLKCLENAEIKDYFEHIITGDMVEKGKPDPEIFLKAISYYPYDKSEIFVLEDGHNGTLAATSAGLRLILVEDIAYVTDEDRNNAELHTDSLFKAIDYLRSINETTPGI